MNFKIRNIWKEGKGIGMMTFKFRALSYASAGLLIVIHNLENNFPFGFLEYATLLALLIMPNVFLYRYVQSGNKIGQLTYDCTYDFFFAGLATGVMNFSIIPSFVFALGATNNYFASRGFHKIYRVLLIPLGWLPALLIDGFQFHFESSNLMLLLSLTYCVVHYLINAYILYYANSLLRLKNKEVEKQQQEILVQSEELRALNDSLKNLNVGLEGKILSRTNELEIKNKKLEEYAFMNAHKLRAPVATILGLIQLFDYKKNEEEADEIIAGLKKTSVELDTAIKGIRAKLEAEHWLPDEPDK